MRWLSLHESHKSICNTLPASSFPSAATTYLCDTCGSDITKHLHHGRAHVWQPMGPQRYRCRCGQSWLSGAVEWDHLGDWERRRRVRDTLAFSVALTVLALIPATATYVILRNWAGAIVTAAIIVATPAMLVAIPFWLSVTASIWRTRFRV